MVEGGHYPRNRPPTLGTTLVDFYHYPVTVWAYSTPQPNTEVPPPTGGRRWGRVSNTSNEDLKDGHLVQQATDLVQQVNHLVFKHTQICFNWQERICMFFFFFFFFFFLLHFPHVINNFDTKHDSLTMHSHFLLFYVNTSLEVFPRSRIKELLSRHCWSIQETQI